MFCFPTVQQINAIRLKLIDVASKEYDKWNQVDGYDEELGSGGICHLIADRMIEILDEEFNTVGKEIFATTKNLSDVQHVNVLVALSDGIYELDLPYWIYETGGGFSWTKKPDVVFETDDIVLYKLDSDLKNIHLYLDYDFYSNDYVDSVIAYEANQKTISIEL